MVLGKDEGEKDKIDGEGEKKHVAISESSVSSPKLIGTTSNYTSAIRHKSSDIHKLF